MAGRLFKVAGRYFEDIEVGDRIITNGRTITETDIITYLNLTGNTEELLYNIEYIKTKSLFKERVVPAKLLLAMADALIIQTCFFGSNILAFLGLDELRINAPLFSGDTITVESEFISKKETKKADRGIITTFQKVRNQKGDEVLSYKVTRMILRKKQED